ncbi:hypothetical protein N7449_005448 [Penicillium cf. viridicatum]|uniref:Uncharacterized protein n=1 Tax=Penicillium cf. viridicatum TaxID=2972119 RepID=A0A9W9ML72_9EURO|nr:hypothetical protein N7449_005448 [Penicillium cf. viridicatum]
MEGPASPGETPKRKKRNPSLRRMLRNEGVDVPPAVQGVCNPLPPKRERNQHKPGRKRAKKRTTTAAAATNEANGPHVSAGSSSPGAGSSGAGLPVAAPSPSPGVSLAVSSSPVALAAEETDADNVVWDPVDPLGLFDELEEPLDWPSEGLFD